MVQCSSPRLWFCPGSLVPGSPWQCRGSHVVLELNWFPPLQKSALQAKNVPLPKIFQYFPCFRQKSLDHVCYIFCVHRCHEWSQADLLAAQMTDSLCSFLALFPGCRPSFFLVCSFAWLNISCSHFLMKVGGTYKWKPCIFKNIFILLSYLVDNLSAVES